jgi:hypothetical protein
VKHQGGIERVRVPSPQRPGEQRGLGVELGANVKGGAVTGMRDLKDKILPPLAVVPVEPDPAPANWMELSDVNTSAKTMIGRKVCVQALNYSLQQEPEYYFLNCYYDNDNTEPSELKFVADKVVYDTLHQFRERNGLKDGFRITVRLHGEIRDTKSNDYKFFVVGRVELVTIDGDPVWKVDRREPHGSLYDSKPAEAARLKKSLERSDQLLTKLAKEPKAVKGQTELIAKVEGINAVTPSKAEPDRKVHRLAIQKDHRGEPVSHLAVFVADDLAEKIAMLFRNDSDLKYDDVAMTLECWRYDETLQSVVASLKDFRVMTRGLVKKVKHEYSSAEVKDLLAPEATPKPAESEPPPRVESKPPTVEP